MGGAAVSAAPFTADGGFRGFRRTARRPALLTPSGFVRARDPLPSSSCPDEKCRGDPGLIERYRSSDLICDSSGVQNAIPRRAGGEARTRRRCWGQFCARRPASAHGLPSPPLVSFLAPFLLFSPYDSPQTGLDYPCPSTVHLRHEPWGAGAGLGPRRGQRASSPPLTASVADGPLRAPSSPCCSVLCSDSVPPVRSRPFTALCPAESIAPARELPGQPRGRRRRGPRAGWRTRPGASRRDPRGAGQLVSPADGRGAFVSSLVCNSFTRPLWGVFAPKCHLIKCEF